MPDLHCFEIRSGGLPCIRFEGLSQNHRRVLAAEFGEEALSLPHPTATPFVSVRFSSVQPSADANFVGRSRSAAHGFLYILEGSAWASIPINGLLEPETNFMVEASPEFD